MSIAIATKPQSLSADALAKQFNKDGFVRIPSVLTAEEVAQLRTFALEKYDQPSEQRQYGDTDNVVFGFYNRFPELRHLLWKEPTLGVLRKILGDDLVLSREHAIQKQYYARWHKDTSPQERGGCQFQWQPDYLMVQVSYYLQDNDPLRGGGLDVEPGSHRQKFDPFLRRERPTKLQKLIDKFIPLGDPIKNPHTVLSKAGDAVLFHFRMNHKATANVSGDNNIPIKMAYMQNFSRNNKHAIDYLNFMTTVPDYAYLKDFVWDAELIREARANNLKLG